ncbi:MAG: threonine synthase [Chloroflexi bacterium]|nr:threonine synthase [Chloroflexota bacterium]
MGLCLLERYRHLLPLTDKTPVITLGEGQTPLVRSRHIGARAGCSELYFKLEGCNPTGSFKDRGMVMAIAKALEEGSQGIMCASTGNTSASAAAYGAYCGIQTIVVIPEGDVAKGKMAQAIAYGAHIVAIDGNFDQALSLVRSLTDKLPFTLVNSVNRYRLEGQKTAAFEIVDELGEPPDYLCIPVGNAGNITAYWKGFTEYKAKGLASFTPRMMGFQAEGASPIVKGHPISSPKTVASAIRIGNPASWKGALTARDESGGAIEIVTDDEIINAYRLLAREEGIFCEPASAASVAGLLKLAAKNLPLQDKRTVCVITGTGLKDPEMASQFAETPIKHLPADLKTLEEHLRSLAR